MAKKLVLVDDIDDTEGAETREFSFDGIDYEIDLNEKNAGNFRADMQQWIDRARVVGRRRSAKKPSSQRSTPKSLPGRALQLDAIREWGRRNGFKVSDRGRPRQEVIDAFNEAHANGKAQFSHA